MQVRKIYEPKPERSRSTSRIIPKAETSVVKKSEGTSILMVIFLIISLIALYFVMLPSRKFWCFNHHYFKIISLRFCRRGPRSFSSTLSGMLASSTFSNWNSLFANVLRASLHLFLSINPSLFRSKSTNTLEIYSLLKMPVLKPCFCLSLSRSMRKSLMF